MTPIQIRAEVLRQPLAFGPSSPMQGFGPIGGAIETAAGSNVRKLWRERDLARAIGAAEKSGLQSYRVEIAPDGTIAIVVGAIEAPAAVCHQVAARG